MNALQTHIDALFSVHASFIEVIRFDFGSGFSGLIRELVRNISGVGKMSNKSINID